MNEESEVGIGMCVAEVIASGVGSMDVAEVVASGLVGIGVTEAIRMWVVVWGLRVIERDLWGMGKDGVTGKWDCRVAETGSGTP